MVRVLVAAAVRVWVAEKVEKEGWAEELLGPRANASVRSAAPSPPTREVFPVSGRNAPSVEPRWYGHNRNVI